jgi:hypothetical protein
MPLDQGPITSVAVAMDRHICGDEVSDEQTEGSRMEILNLVKHIYFFDKT